jgi:hypothetical protein
MILSTPHSIIMKIIKAPKLFRKTSQLMVKFREYSAMEKKKLFLPIGLDVKPMLMGTKLCILSMVISSRLSQMVK